MQDISDSARERNGKNAAERHTRGAFRDACIRRINNDHRLTEITKLVAATLVTLYPNSKLYKSHGKLVTWPNVRSLARDCGTTKSTANRALAALVEHGHLSEWTGPVFRKLAGRPSKVYAFTDPPPAEYFVPSWAGQSGGKALSYPVRDKVENETEETLSQTEGDFVPNGEDFVPRKCELGPKTLDSASVPFDIGSRDKEGHVDKESRGAGADSENPGKAFEKFWAQYPLKKAKLAAQKASERAVKHGTAPQEIMAGVMRYAADRDGQDPKYTKHAATWLNGGCWADEVSLPARGKMRKDKDGREWEVDEATGFRLRL